MKSRKQKYSRETVYENAAADGDGRESSGFDNLIDF